MSYSIETADGSFNKTYKFKGYHRINQNEFYHFKELPATFKDTCICSKIFDVAVKKLDSVFSTDITSKIL